MKNSRINHRAHSAPTNRFHPASSTKRALASRRNGARSHGPVSDQGKLKSRLNSLKHGYFATNPLIVSAFYRENPKQFNELLNELRNIYQPANLIEESFVYDAAVVLVERRRYREFGRGMLKKQVAEMKHYEIEHFKRMQQLLFTMGKEVNEIDLQFMDADRCLDRFDMEEAIDFDETQIEPEIREPYMKVVMEQIELAKKGSCTLSESLQTELSALGTASEISFETILHCFVKINGEQRKELLDSIVRTEKNLKSQKRRVAKVVRENLVLGEADIDKLSREDSIDKRFDKIIKRLLFHQDMRRQQEEFDRQEQSRRKLPNRKR
jgi:hypothetical protein